MKNSRKTPFQHPALVAVALFSGLGVSNALSPVEAAEKVAIDQMAWDFETAMDKPLETLKAVGWTFNDSAESADAVTAKDSHIGTLSNYLALYDNDAKGTPEITIPLTKRPNGEISFKAALMGAKNHYGTIRLMQGKTVLSEIVLLNELGGHVKTGNGESNFQGRNWKTMGGEIRMLWTEKGEISVEIADWDKTVSKEKFITQGVPDSLQFSVGFWSGTNKGLAIDDLKLGFPTLSK